MSWELIFWVVFPHTPETSHGSIHRFHGWTVLGFCLQKCALTSSLRSSFVSFPPVGGVMAIAVLIIHFLGDIDGSGGSTAISWTLTVIATLAWRIDFFELHCKQVRTLLCMIWIRRMDSVSEIASCKARYRKHSTSLHLNSNVTPCRCTTAHAPTNATDHFGPTAPHLKELLVWEICHHH